MEVANPPGVCPLVPPSHIIHRHVGEIRMVGSGAGQARHPACILLGWGGGGRDLRSSKLALFVVNCCPLRRADELFLLRLLGMVTMAAPFPGA